MSTNQKQLLSILQIVQIQLIYIQKLMYAAVCSELRQVLKEQYNTYRAIELEVYTIASSRGWDIWGIDPLKIKIISLRCRIRLFFFENDSKIAETLIQGNARRIITNIRNSKNEQLSDNAVATLSHILLVCTVDTVKRMMCFL